MGIGTEDRHNERQLFQHLANQPQNVISTFVETGTYQGDTTLWAAKHFGRVITIEAAESLFVKSKQKLSRQSNVECLCGDSGELLRELAFDTDETVLFWLDAHWSCGETFGENHECPLVDELDAIYTNCANPYVVIDDATFFTSIPPEPHDVEQWPTILQIADQVRGFIDAFVTVVDQTIVIVPYEKRQVIYDFVRRPQQEVTSVAGSRFGWFRRKKAEAA